MHFPGGGKEKRNEREREREKERKKKKKKLHINFHTLNSVPYFQNCFKTVDPTCIIP
jgi:hypothetical protein